jgi:saccharopine dehydrogenase (NAD+, L-lysine-forming)
VKWLVDRSINVEVESNPLRVFKDASYKRSGAKVVKKVGKATLLVGIKEPHVENILDNKIYMLFSHTTKGQPQNMPLLKRFLDGGATLIDYEKITDIHNRRLVYFGRFAGICGIVDCLYYLGKKLKWKGIDNPFEGLKPAWKYRSLKELKKDMGKIDRNIRSKGFDSRISPFIIGITGHGNVSKGVQEVLGLLSPAEVHPKDMGKFIRHQKYIHNEIYKIVFFREEKLRAKDKKGFYFEEYLEHPERFESNLDKYISHLNMLVHTSYWDKRYPRMLTKSIIKRLSRRKDFRLEFVGDVSCDVSGSVELTYKATSPDHAVYTYDPKKDRYIDGYKTKGITLLAVDNLPAELPVDSSQYFSGLIREYVYQIAAHGAMDITNHVAVPREVRDAVITQNGKLTKDYKYLAKSLS